LKEYTVKELMVPLSEYATVFEGATLFEAISALEKAQEEFDHYKYRHRAVLVLDKNRQVVGKLGHMDVIRALEPTPEYPEELDELAQFDFSPAFVRDLKRQGRLKSAPLKDLCISAMTIKVEDLMHAPAEAECIDQEASVVMAMQQLVMGNHLSLLATQGQKIVGILRLTDVFAAVFHAMKEYETKAEVC
jgi:CBS domain-containing protein